MEKMKLLRFRQNGNECFGLLDNDIVREIKGNPFSRFEPGDKHFSPDSTELLPPVEPSKIIGVGLNYIDHAKELRMDIPENPLIFMKPPTSVIGPEAEILYPKMSQHVEYEAEIVVVIKNRIRNVSAREAGTHILGYTCGNDVTARDLQQKDGQWTRAKSFDTFCAIGPWIVCGICATDLKIEMLLNGEVVQSSTTANMIFNIYELVSFISQIMTLLPGDIIMTGTPPGVGPVQPGDTTEVRIEGIGTLRNYVADDCDS